jgi:hypothetical protein
MIKTVRNRRSPAGAATGPASVAGTPVPTPEATHAASPAVASAEDRVDATRHSPAVVVSEGRVVASAATHVF